MAPNRKQRGEIAQQTLKIICQGFYEVADSLAKVDIKRELDKSLEESTEYDPNHLDTLRKRTDFKGLSGASSTNFEVTQEFSIEACHRLFQEEAQAGRNTTIACLNFASAKNAGGGFLKGSQAQEESLALCSALYPTLTKHESGYYATNRADPKNGLYNDNLIYSPGVVVFREDKNLFLVQDKSVIDFITCPAVNKGLLVKRREVNLLESVEQVMRRRVDNVLSVAADRKVDLLVLGAWGTGVFRNDTAAVAGYFSRSLKNGGKFENVFSRVVFAVGSEQPKVDIFKNTFCP